MGLLPLILRRLGGYRHASVAARWLRTILDRLPHGRNQLKYGLTDSPPPCPLCSAPAEDLEHLPFCSHSAISSHRNVLLATLTSWCNQAWSTSTIPHKLLAFLRSYIRSVFDLRQGSILSPTDCLSGWLGRTTPTL